MQIARPMPLTDGAIAPSPSPTGRGARAPRWSGTRRLQGAHPDQVEDRSGEGQDPIDQRPAAMTELPQPTDGLHPAPHLFDQLPFLLADRVARMSRRAPIDGTAAAPSGPRGASRRDPARPRRSWPRRTPCRSRPCCPAARWRPAGSARPRARRCPWRPSRRDSRSSRAGCRSARGPGTPSDSRGRSTSDTAARRDRSSRHAWRCAAVRRGS